LKADLNAEKLIREELENNLKTAATSHLLKVKDMAELSLLDNQLAEKKIELEQVKIKLSNAYLELQMLEGTAFPNKLHEILIIHKANTLEEVCEMMKNDKEMMKKNIEMLQNEKMKIENKCGNLEKENGKSSGLINYLENTLFTVFTDYGYITGRKIMELFALSFVGAHKSSEYGCSETFLNYRITAEDKIIDNITNKRVTIAEALDHLSECKKAPPMSFFESWLEKLNIYVYGLSIKDLFIDKVYEGYMLDIQKYIEDNIVAIPPKLQLIAKNIVALPIIVLDDINKICDTSYILKNKKAKEILLSIHNNWQYYE